MDKVWVVTVNYHKNEHHCITSNIKGVYKDWENVSDSIKADIININNNIEDKYKLVYQDNHVASYANSIMQIDYTYTNLLIQ